jgi:hypothetical protein
MLQNQSCASTSNACNEMKNFPSYLTLFTRESLKLTFFNSKIIFSLIKIFHTNTKTYPNARMKTTHDTEKFVTNRSTKGEIIITMSVVMMMMMTII